MNRMNADAQKKLVFERAIARLALYKNGYRVEKIIESNLNYIIYKQVPAVLVYRSAFKKFLLIPRFRNITGIQTTTLFTLPEWSSRKDYEEIVNYAGAGLKSKYIYRLSALTLRPAFHLKHLFHSINAGKGVEGLSFRQKFYIIACLYNILLMIDHAEKHIQVQVQKYVSFSCVMGIENLLTQYFQKRHIPTYNLQHGITYLYEKNLVDEIEYRNLITDHHLAWGNYTRDELMRYGMSESRISIAGYPRKTVRQTLKKPVHKKCLIFLSRIGFQQANRELLSMLAAFNSSRTEKFCFLLRLHPSLDIYELKKIINAEYSDAGFKISGGNHSLQKIFEEENIDFCIAVNSTTYYECYIHGVPALRFKTADFDMSHSLAEDTFETTGEFSALITDLYENFRVAFSSEKIAEELDYVLGLQKNEYTRLLS